MSNLSNSKDKIVKTVCSTCYCSCGVLAQVKNGRVVEIKGDPEHPSSKGALCPRGLSALELLYHPDRLNYPLKRVGMRGEGKWQRITWDEALDTISERFTAIKERYGPEAICITNGAALYHNLGTSRYMAYALGTPNYINAAYICFMPSAMAALATTGFKVPITATEVINEEALNSSCILLWGANPRVSVPYPVGEGIFEVKKRGTKLIVIDPRPTDYAKVADYWLQLRPGTDDALALGMLNTIIKEEIYDKEFVSEWCFGFDKLKTHVEEYTPARVSEITWVPAKNITEAARMFAKTKPASIVQRVPLDQSYNSVQTSRAILILGCICGNLDMQGGIPLPTPMPIKSELAIAGYHDQLPRDILEKRLGAKEFPLASGPHLPGGITQPAMLINAILNGEPYRIRALLTSANNFVLMMQDTRKIWKGLQELDFLVTMDQFMTPGAELSDVVLPACCWLERDGVRGHPAYPFVIPIQHRAVEPLHERRDDVDFLIELARRMGADPPWQNSIDLANDQLSPMGVTIEDLDGKNFLARPREYERHKKGRIEFPTPSKKVEIYSNLMEKWGFDPLPPYKAPPQLTSEFPLVYIGGGKYTEYMHSSGRQLNMLRKNRPDPTLEMSPETAKEKGIRNGDWVWLETSYFENQERIKFKVDIIKGLHSKVVFSANGWWFPEMPAPEHGVFEANPNVVIPAMPYDPIFGSANLRSVPCRIYKV
jgi:thiosulfate reductase/polysulfide reductase chain A